MKKQRQANLELLRIIAMLMVILTHTVNHGNILYSTTEGSFDYYLAWALFGISFVCINLYVLISSYFLIDGRFSTYKLAKLEAQVLFYALGITLVYWIFGDVEHEVKYMVYSVTPVASDFYWFITMYVGMYILAPFMNRFIRMLTKRQLEFLMAVCFLLFSVWPNVFYYSSALNIAGGVCTTWFLVVYLFGAWLKLYYRPDGKFGKHLLRAVLALFSIPVSRFLIELLLKTPLGNISFLDDLMWGYSLFYTYSSVLVCLAAFLTFIAFLNLEIKPGKAAKVINVLASTSFGVYLLHDHYYVRESLWAVLNMPQYIGKWYLVFVIILAVIAIYLICSVVEILRQFVMRPIENHPRVRGFFAALDGKILKLWRGEDRPEK